MKNRETKSFSNKLFCIYQATSDDLIFWAMFDVLILTLNKGFSTVQVSLIFTISYWVSIVLQVPSYYLSQKLKAGGSIVTGAFLFLSASLMITFGNAFVLVTVGQCFGLIAGSFQKMSSVILKDAASRFGKKQDYVNTMSASNVIYSILTLVAACSFNSLYRINPDLPMYICTLFCVNSCMMSIVISRYSVSAENETRELIPGKKKSALDQTSVVCLILIVLGTMIFVLAEDNLKLLLRYDLSQKYSNGRVVAIFSIIVIVTRVVKLFGNLLSYIAGRKGKENLRVFSVIILVISSIGILGIASFYVSGWLPIIFIGIAIFAKASVFDPFRVYIDNFMLNRLKNDDMMFVLYVRNLATGLFNAFASTLATIIIARSSIFGVMVLISVLIVLLIGLVIFFRRKLIRSSGGQKFFRWGKKEMDQADELMVALAVLMEQYRVVRDRSFTPNELSRKVNDIRYINKEYKGIDVFGRFSYSKEKLKELYGGGHPCAILARADDMENAEWMPVIFLDDDGGVVWNYTSAEKFIAHMVSIEEIYSFKLEGKYENNHDTVNCSR